MAQTDAYVTLRLIDPWFETDSWDESDDDSEELLRVLAGCTLVQLSKLRHLFNDNDDSPDALWIDYMDNMWSDADDIRVEELPVLAHRLLGRLITLQDFVEHELQRPLERLDGLIDCLYRKIERRFASPTIRSQRPSSVDDKQHLRSKRPSPVDDKQHLRSKRTRPVDDRQPRRSERIRKKHPRRSTRVRRQPKRLNNA